MFQDYLQMREKLRKNAVAIAVIAALLMFFLWFFYLRFSPPNERLAWVLVNEPEKWSFEKQQADTTFLLDVSLSDRVFEDMDFSGVVFRGGEFRNVKFIRCNLSGMGLSAVRWNHILISESKMGQFSIYRSSIENVDVYHSSMSAGSIRHSSLQNVLFRNFEISGSERSTFFEEVKFKNVRFEDSRLDSVFLQYPEVESLVITRTDMGRSAMRARSTDLSIEITEYKNCPVTFERYCK